MGAPAALAHLWEQLPAHAQVIGKRMIERLTEMKKRGTGGRSWMRYRPAKRAR